MTSLPSVPYLDVVCGIISSSADGREILAAQRPVHKSQGGLWELPGGKVEKDEDPREALKREIREELGVEIEVLNPLPSVRHDYGALSIHLIPFTARIISGHLSPTEHSALCWIAPAQWPDLNWAEADVPILKHLAAEVLAPWP